MIDVIDTLFVIGSGLVNTREVIGAIWNKVLVKNKGDDDKHA